MNYELKIRNFLSLGRIVGIKRCDWLKKTETNCRLSVKKLYLCSWFCQNQKVKINIKSSYRDAYTTIYQREPRTCD